MAIEKDYTVEYWRSLLEQEAPDLPVERLIAWEAMESNGFPQALGACTEVGIFQVDVQDGPKYGGSQATLHANFCAAPCSSTRVRDLTDDEELLQVTTGVAMARDYLAQAQSMLAAHNLDWSDDDVWCLVKSHHALPIIPTYLLPACDQDGQAGSWDSFRSWCLGLSTDQVNSYTHGDRSKYMPLDRYFDNAEKVGHASGVTNALGLAGFVDPQLLLGMGAAFAALLLLRHLIGGAAL